MQQTCRSRKTMQRSPIWVIGILYNPEYLLNILQEFLFDTSY